MNSVPLIVSLINKSKAEILDVLQGISRYIEEIHVQRWLIETEGIKILTFLKARYPKKKIVVDISHASELNPTYATWIKRSPVKTFIISGNLTPTHFKAFAELLKKRKKEIIVKGPRFPQNLLSKFEVKKLFFYQSQPKKQNRLWTEKEYLKMKSLIKKGYHLLIGDININNLFSLKKIPASGFTISEEICYSFNPLESSKNIYLKIKEEYASE